MKDATAVNEQIIKQDYGTTQEIVINNRLEISALIELLTEKGIINQEELIERCKRLRVKMRGR